MLSGTSVRAFTPLLVASSLTTVPVARLFETYRYSRKYIHAVMCSPQVVRCVITCRDACVQKRDFAVSGVIRIHRMRKYVCVRGGKKRNFTYFSQTSDGYLCVFRSSHVYTRDKFSSRDGEACQRKPWPQTGLPTTEQSWGDNSTSVPSTHMPGGAVLMTWLRKKFKHPLSTLNCRVHASMNPLHILYKFRRIIRHMQRTSFCNMCRRLQSAARFSERNIVCEDIQHVFVYRKNPGERLQISSHASSVYSLHKISFLFLI